ncbi:MAG: methionine gamma-lyase family protein [Selenomonadaceae bacterium]|nr:methionine gamma-lyase family protein [Selenomonadaceae bacterium]MBR7025219.1 methionine gamma-lyase family protein [Selenomonadaceae bacterium]
MFSQRLIDLKKIVLAEAAENFKRVEEISEHNTLKVLEAMRRLKISDAHFKTSTGYAYGDIGREKLDELFAEVFKSEAALVRTQFVSGTHALATALFGILRPNDELVSLTGAPYDTLQTVIGHAHASKGSLKEFGIGYRELDLVEGKVDIAAIKNFLTPKTKLALIQRSRGYSMREPLTTSDIEKICAAVKAANPDCVTFVDNCYGEFVEPREPIEVGADLAAGSLIKNIGGGLAPTGGYIVGKSDLVESASYRLTAPGMGDELGASLGTPRLLYQGLFMAPHVTAQALKGAIFAAGIFSKLGYKTHPLPEDKRGDIIQAIELRSAQRLIKFCQAIQKFSPVDSFATPEAWDMPGYSDKVIMAAGTFVQGASIELSADAPLREPYAVYLQGGLTFEHAAIGILSAAQELEEL